jgi:hypothetical protein
MFCFSKTSLKTHLIIPKDDAALWIYMSKSLHIFHSIQHHLLNYYISVNLYEYKKIKMKMEGEHSIPP